MSQLRIRGQGPVVLEANEVEAAGDAARLLREALSGDLVGPAAVRLLMADPIEQTVFLPATAAELLADMLTELANGNAVTLVPTHAELTTQQAADVLGVSRPYLVGLLESGQIPFRRVGNRRKVGVSDLITYRSEDDARTKQAVDELTREAEDQGFYED